MLKKAFGLFGISVILLAIFLPGYSKLQELKERNSELSVKIKRLTVENALLQEELKKIDSDPLHQEKIAREKLGVVRKGEIPVKVVPERQ
ncbi:MAG: septum formation initiator family protein [Candidatus Omnitrophica bacterium]|nr:septum formation initiator family protein [Candidatus Omnitrophota bacterium]